MDSSTGFACNLRSCCFSRHFVRSRTDVSAAFPAQSLSSSGGLLPEDERSAITSGASVFSNQLLAKLPPSELEQIVPYLELQELSRHTLLCDPEKPIRFGYFLNSGMASCLIVTGGGRSVEVALVGKGGFIGSPLAFGIERSLLRIVMQVPGDGYRVNADALQKILTISPTLYRKLARDCLMQG